MAGRAQHSETTGQIFSAHRLPDHAQRLVGTLAVQRGSGRFGGEPLKVPLARLRPLVPGVQRVAGVRADVRRRRELAPGRAAYSPSISTRSAATVRSNGDIDSAASRISL